MSNNVAKVLVVDDTPANLAVMRRLLGKLDCELVEASSGNEALAAVLEDSDFALILLDVQMPEMDGYEVASLVRSDEETAHVPIVFVTAAAHDELHELQGYEVGAVDYVTKPIRPQILVSKVAVFLELWRNRHAIEDANRRLEDTVAERTRELQTQLEATAEARRLAESALRKAEQAEGVRARFVARISHELRTPLNGIMGTLQLIDRDAIAPAQLQYLDAIDVSATALMVTLNELLDFADLVGGKIVTDQISFDLRKLINSQIERLRMLADEKRLGLSVEIAQGLPDALVGDPGKLGRIISNLVGNAIRFSDRGEILVRVLGDADERAARLRIEIIDQGPGIPANVLACVFDGFSQADDSATRVHYGVGLGLAISYELARAMGGRLGLDSEVGAGTTAWLELSLARARADQQVAAPAGGAVDFRHNPLHVLVAEDNPVNQMVVAGMLKRLHCDADLAANGEVAVERYRHGEYDLVIMDLDMPIMDGFQAAREIRRLGKEAGRRRLPIIALTANVSSKARSDCVDAGIDGFVGKPITFDLLMDALQRWVEPVPPEAGEVQPTGQ